MLKVRHIGIAIVVLFTPIIAFSEEIDFKALSETQGVSKVILNKKKQIITVYVNGRAPISTTLGKTRGIEAARKRADQNANAELVKWLSSKVTIIEDTKDETITVIEGMENGEEGALQETAKAIEKSTTKFTAVAENMVRGLTVAHIEQNGEDKLMVVIKKLDVTMLGSIKNLQRNLNSEEKKLPNKKVPNKNVPSKSKTVNP